MHDAPRELRRRQAPIAINVPGRFVEESQSEDQGDDEELPDLGPDAAFAQQSIYGLIAAAQSRGAFRPQPQSDSGSDSEVHDEGSKAAGVEASGPGAVPTIYGGQDKDSADAGGRHNTKRIVSGPLLRPVQKHENQGSSGRVSASQSLLPEATRPSNAPVRSSSSQSSTTPSEAPIMEKRLRAEARAEANSSASNSGIRLDGELRPDSGTKHRPPVLLSEALADIFQFEEPEDIIAEHPCWYLQSVLLQGYLYITRSHVCFYAYLPKKGNVVLKSGYLTKQSSTTLRHRRFWFSLKGDVLSYYSSAAQPYFPKGTIDLRYGVAADMVAGKEQASSAESTAFVVTTDTRTHYFRAHSEEYAKEWVRQIQRSSFDLATIATASK